MQTNHAKNWAIAIVLGILGTIQYHLAQFTSSFDIVFGDRGDVRGIVYFCEHWYLWLIGKVDLMSPGIFYPTKNTLAYSDFLVGYAIPYAIARLLGFGMFSSIEIVVILFTFLNYLACYLLLKHVLNFKLLPSCAAAMFFAFSSPKFHQLSHLQLQYVVLLPLIFACIVLFVRKSQTVSQREAAGWLSAATILFVLQTATAFYYAWFFVLWTLLFLIVSLALGPSRRLILALIQKYWRAAAVAGVVLLLGFAFIVRSYLPGLRGGQWYKYDFVSQMIPSWWSLIWMGEGNYVWGWTSAAVLPEPRPSTWGELRAGFGLVPTIAWIVSIVWVVRRMRSRKSDRTFGVGQMFLAAAILTTALFFLIGFKYGSHSPWFYIYQYFPGGKAIRAVARYVIFLSLPMAIAFGFLMDRALDWAGKQTMKTARAITVAIALIAAFGVFEQFGVFKVGGTGFSKKVEEAYLQSMAGKLPGGCNAFYVTPGTDTHSTAEYHYDAMLISIMSGVPTLNASSSQFPTGWELYFVNDPNYETNVRKWIELNGIKGKVCRLEIDPQVEAFDINAPTPLNDDSLFVRQHFRDFAGRDATPSEVEQYTRELQNCKTTGACDAAAVSLKIFRDTGFLDDGTFLFRLYQVGLARAPKYDEFTSDLNVFRGAKQKDRRRFIEDFITRREFAAEYSPMSSRDFVGKLIDNAKVSISSEARRELETGKKSQAQILLELTDSPEVSRQLGNDAIVTLLYFGYLRRDPDPDGFANWQEFLQRTGDSQLLISKFISSVEYRRRFASLTQ